MQPLITMLRQEFGENATVDLICLKRSMPAASLLSGLNQVHAIERGTGEVLEALKGMQYHHLLDMHGSVRSRSLAKSLDALTFQVDKQWWNRWCLTQGLRREPVAPFVDRCLDAVKAFNLPKPAPDAWGEAAWGTMRLEGALPHALTGRKDLLVLSLGSSQPGKHLSDDVVEATIAAAEDQKQTVVLVGGSDVQPRCEALAARHQSVLNGAGRWTLTEVALAIREANALVSGDTATMHLGAALGVPTLAVWGCTRPTLGLAPWRPHPQSDSILPQRPAQARPCSKHGATCRHTSSKDPMDPKRCGQLVDPEGVRAWIQEVVG